MQSNISKIYKHGFRKAWLHRTFEVHLSVNASLSILPSIHPFLFMSKIVYKMARVYILVCNYIFKNAIAIRVLNYKYVCIIRCWLCGLLFVSVCIRCAALNDKIISFSIFIIIKLIILPSRSKELFIIFIWGEMLFD